MDGIFTSQPEGFDALRAQNGVVNRLCERGCCRFSGLQSTAYSLRVRSLHDVFYSLFCTPNCVKRSCETYVNRT